jgi:hypothetical protein
MESNYIYLLKEREFIHTCQDIYKIGMTKKPNHQRFNQYPKGSILLFQMICSDCNYFEKKLIALFKEKFVLRKDIGNEYFEGNYEIMMDYIYSTIRNIPSATQEEEKEERKDIVIHTPKESIKLILDDEGKYHCHYWNKSETEQHYCLSDVMDDYERNYFMHLLMNNIICLETMYDLQNTEFVDLLMAHKQCIEIEKFDEFASAFDKNEETMETKIWGLLCLNVAINNTVFATIRDNIYKYIHELNDFDFFDVDIGRFVSPSTSKYVSIYFINSRFYCCETFFMKHMPYEIRWNKKHEYYHLNRRNEFTSALASASTIGESSWTGSYILFNDSNKPWESKKNYKRFLKEYNKIITEKSLSHCLNKEQLILSLL